MQVQADLTQDLTLQIARQHNKKYNYNKAMVKIYSTPTCVYCKTLKEYLRRNKVEFQDIDVSKSEKDLQEMITLSGQMGVPVVDIDGEVVVGFDKQKIDGLLKIAS